MARSQPTSATVGHSAPASSTDPSEDRRLASLSGRIRSLAQDRSPPAMPKPADRRATFLYHARRPPVGVHERPHDRLAGRTWSRHSRACAPRNLAVESGPAGESNPGPPHSVVATTENEDRSPAVLRGVVLARRHLRSRVLNGHRSGALIRCRRGPPLDGARGGGPSGRGAGGYRTLRGSVTVMTSQELDRSRRRYPTERLVCARSIASPSMTGPRAGAAGHLAGAPGCSLAHAQRR